MRTPLRCAMCAGALALSGATLLTGASPLLDAPSTPARPVVDVVHGVTLTDPYRWLENGNDPEVQAWTRRQHEATLRFLEQTAAPVPGLHEELVAYIDRDITQPPFFKKDREFFLRTRKGEPQAKLYTRIAGTEVLLFDPVALDPSGKTAIRSVVPNRDGSRAAVSTFSKGSEITDFRIIDTMTGVQIGPLLEGVDRFHWARDERYAYIVPRTRESIEKQELQRVYRHRLGEERASDVLMLVAADRKFWVAVYEPEEAPVTVFETGDYASNTIRIRPQASTAAPTTIYSSSEFKAEADFREDRIYIRTNDHAPRFKLMAASYDRPQFENWRTLWPEQETVLDHVDVTARYVVIRDKKDVLTRLWAHDLAGKRLRELALPEVGNVTASSYDRDRRVIYADVATFTAPAKLYSLDGASLKWSLLWEDRPPLDTTELESELVFYPSRDGTRIPMFILHRKGLLRDGNNAVYLTAYGGFNIGITPAYVGSLATFINRGGVVARAGIRGGDEYGEAWHRAGSFANKQNVFDDFIAAAEFLIRDKYTSRDRLLISGGSNGGLLVGAVLTQRPDLFKAAVCQVPLLDMVRFHKFLIARPWTTEYGDPDQPADFAYLLSYSPYHNIRMGVNLPETLVIAGEYDSRVDPLHAKKFVAALQNNVGQVDPVLLYMDFDSGHGYGKSKEQTTRDLEYQLRFVFSRLGVR